MQTTRIRPTRETMSADASPAAATPRAPGHDEWLIDEALEETFPASDTPNPSRPGSLVSLHYAGVSDDERAAARRRTGGAATPWLLLGSVVLFVLVLAARRR